MVEQRQNSVRFINEDLTVYSAVPIKFNVIKHVLQSIFFNNRLIIDCLLTEINAGPLKISSSLIKIPQCLHLCLPFGYALMLACTLSITGLHDQLSVAWLPRTILNSMLRVLFKRGICIIRKHTRYLCHLLYVFMSFMCFIFLDNSINNVCICYPLPTFSGFIYRQCIFSTEFDSWLIVLPVILWGSV